MPKRKLQRQETVQDKNQIQPERLDNTPSSLFRWNLSLIPPLLALVFLGALIGSAHPVGQSVLLGILLGAFVAYVGFVVLVLLVRILRALNRLLNAPPYENQVSIFSVRDKRQSRRSLFWWSVVVLTSSLVGAILGFFFLPGTLLVPLRVLLGACIGSAGLILLIAVIADPLGSLAEGMAEFVQEGCCLGFLTLWLAMAGTIGGLFLWHSSLLGVLTGGSALVAQMVLVSLAFSSRNREVGYGSKATAP